MIGIAKGMRTVFGHLFKPTFTIQYPQVKRELPERSRMSFELRLDENGVPLCKSCLLCQKSCQDNAISIESEKREDGPGRKLTRFTLDLGRCMYCGICEEQCSSGSLVASPDFETSSPERAGLVRVLYEEAAVCEGSGTTFQEAAAAASSDETSAAPVRLEEAGA